MAQTRGRVTQCICQEFRRILTAYSSVSHNYANVNAQLLDDSSGIIALFWFNLSRVAVASTLEMQAC